MAQALSKSQIDRLGERLVSDEKPADADLELLRQLLLVRSDQLDRVEARVRERLGIVPTSRVKNTETILEKLRRSGGSGLKSIQDLAGMRIVGAFDRRGQDDLVERLVALFTDSDRAPKVVDRRDEPMHGYRAVHVIVFPEGAPIEIQVRTEWQHEWAEFFEKLADTVGRGIRYGEPPTKRGTHEEVPGSSLRTYFEAEYELRTALVELALIVARMIDTVEVAEVAAPNDPLLHGYRREVEDRLALLRQNLQAIDAVGKVADGLRP